MTPPVPIPEGRPGPYNEMIPTGVVFSQEGLHGTYSVEQLSVGSAFLAGGPALAVGRRITLLLKVPGKPLVRRTARVVGRADPDSAGAPFAVAFMESEPEQLAA